MKLFTFIEFRDLFKIASTLNERLLRRYSNGIYSSLKA